jgi:hypothetical protein
VRRLLPAVLALAAPILAVQPDAGVDAEASPVQVVLAADTTEATVGDRITLRVEVTHPRDVTVDPPVPAGEPPAALILEAIPSPARAEEGEETPAPGAPRKTTFHLQAQVFETGETAIPALRIGWKGPGDAAGSVITDPLPIRIVSVLKGESPEPADLKPPVGLPPPPFPWGQAAGLALAALAAAAGIWFWIRRRRPAAAAPSAPPAPAIPPHETAYRELERLLASDLLERGRIKEFHVELADIARRYLAGRFEIETLERTSEEVLDDLRRARVGSEPLRVVHRFFERTDLVKFARHVPSPDEIRGTVELAYELVDRTKLSAPARPAAGARAETPPGGVGVPAPEAR